MQYLGSPEKGEPITGSPTPIAIDERVTISSIPSCLLSIFGSQNPATTGNPTGNTLNHGLMRDRIKIL